MILGQHNFLKHSCNIATDASVASYARIYDYKCNAGISKMKLFYCLGTLGKYKHNLGSDDILTSYTKIQLSSVNPFW